MLPLLGAPIRAGHVVRGAELGEQFRHQTGPEVGLGVVPGVEAHLAHGGVGDRVVGGRGRRSRSHRFVQHVQELALAVAPLPEHPDRQRRLHRAGGDDVCERCCVPLPVQGIGGSGAAVRAVPRRPPDRHLPHQVPQAHGAVLVAGGQHGGAGDLTPRGAADRAGPVGQRRPQRQPGDRVPQSHGAVLPAGGEHWCLGQVAPGPAGGAAVCPISAEPGSRPPPGRRNLTVPS